MKRTMLSTIAHLIGNAVGLLLASILLTGFSIKPLAFVIVVLVFTAAAVVALPLLTRISEKNMPSLMGGIALITTFVGLFVTDILVPGFEIGGLANWLAATLLVWLGAVIAGVLIPIYLFKELRETKG